MITITNPEVLGLSRTRLARIDAHMQRYVDDGKLAGIVTLIARRGQIAQIGCAGAQTVEEQQPMQPDSLFRIHSMTKPITSVAAMLLVEEGRLLLQDPVAKYISSFHEVQVGEVQQNGDLRLVKPARPMKIHDLFLHTAGLSYGYVNDAPVEAAYRASNWRAAATMAERVAAISALPLAHHPGTAWQYGVSTDILGHVVELITGMSLADFFQERIFDPLGMHDTAFWVPPEKLPRFTALYEPNPAGGICLADAPATSQYTKPPRLFSGGSGLVSTAPDYFRFAQMLLQGGELDGAQVLGRKSVEFMSMNHLPATLLPMRLGGDTMHGYGFGLGFSVVLDPARYGVLSSVGTLGWSGTATTAFWIDPQEALIGILMTQFTPSYTYPLSKQFKNLVNQALVS